MKKKFLSMMLTTAMVLGLTACGGSEKPVDGGAGQAGTEKTEAGSEAGSKEEVSGERTTLRVMMYDRGNTTETYGSPTDNYWTDWMQKEFGDPNNITLEYVAVPRGEDDKKINTMMAAGEAPDIIFSYTSSMMFDFGRDGGLYELTDLINEYGPNLKENLAASLPYGVSEGQQWLIPATRSEAGWQTTYIRKDWLDEVGYELQTDENGVYHMSVEDFESLLRQFKDLDPEGQGAEMYPLGMIGAWNAGQTKPIIWSFLDTAALTDEMHATVNEMFWPGYKEGVRFLNTLYNDGLVDPDFMVDTDTGYSAFKGLLTNGRTLAFGHDAVAAGPGGAEDLYKADPEAELVAFYLDNVNGEQFNRVYAPTGMYIAIPATCEHPENAIKYLDFLAVPENAKVLQYGFEGVHYEIENENQVVRIEYTDEEKAASEYDFERLTVGDMVLVYNGNPYGWVESPKGMEEAKGKSYILGAQSLKSSVVGGRVDYYFQGIETEADKQYKGLVKDPTQNLPLLISCPPEEFDATYDQILNDYLEAGGQAIQDDKVKLYNELEAAK